MLFKRLFLFIAFISCILVLHGNALAVPVTQSVYGTISSVISPVDHAADYDSNYLPVVDGAVIHLFDVEYDNANTAYSYLSGPYAGTETTLADMSSYYPVPEYASNASFIFSPDVISMFYWMGLNDDEIYQPMQSYAYGTIDHSLTWLGYSLPGGQSVSLMSYDIPSLQYTSVSIGQAWGFSTDTDDNGNPIMTVEDLAMVNFTNLSIETNYGVNQAPVPGTILLLGSGIIGLAGFRKKFIR